ncbi:hypothetical protein ABPG72_002266 [Tetrahymena utriculariae]
MRVQINQPLQAQQDKQIQKADIGIQFQNTFQEQNQNNTSQNSSKNPVKKPFQNFIISKYEAMSDRDFKKVPISYINQIYKMQSIDLMKLHQEASKSIQEMSQSSIQFYQTKYSLQQNRGAAKMNQTLDNRHFHLNNKFGFSPQSSLSNSPTNSFFQDQKSNNSRSLSIVQKLDQNKFDSIKEENIPVREEQNIVKIKKTTSVFTSPSFSGSFSHNRNLIKTQNVEIRSLVNKNNFSTNKLFFRQQKQLQQNTQFPNIFKQVENNQLNEIKDQQFRKDFKEWQQQFINPSEKLFHSQTSSKKSDREIQNNSVSTQQSNSKAKTEQKELNKMSQKIESFASRNQIDSISLKEMTNRQIDSNCNFQEYNLNSSKQQEYFFVSQYSNSSQNNQFKQEQNQSQEFQNSHLQKNSLSQIQSIPQNQVNKNNLQKIIQVQRVQSPLLQNFKANSETNKNVQKFSITQNSFLIQQDEQQDKLKRENINFSQKAQNNKNLTIQINRLSNQNSFELNKSGEMETGQENSQSIKNNGQINQLEMNKVSQQESSNNDNQNSQQKEIKINESKFVLHKPNNYKKNKVYLKNVQKNNTSPVASPSQIKQTHKKSPVTPSDNKKSVENSNQVLAQQFFQNSPTFSKNKSQFSKQQESLTKISSDEIDEKHLKAANVNSIIFRNQEKETMQNFKIKNEIEEIKSAFVRSILEEQAYMYQENYTSLETKIFERKRQEHQINFKTNIHQGDQQKNQSNKQFPLLQEIQQLKKNYSNNNSALNRTIDLSNSPQLNRGSPKSCQTPKLSNIQLEDVFFQVRRSSMQLNKPNLKTQQSLQEGDQYLDIHSQVKNQAIAEIAKQNTELSMRRSQFSNLNFTSATSEQQQSLNNPLPELKIQIQNKNSVPEQSPQNQKRNSKLSSEINKFQPQASEGGQSFSNSPTLQKSAQKQSISMFSKMHNPLMNMNRRQSKIVVIDSDIKLANNNNENNSHSISPLNINDNNKKICFSKQLSSNSDESVDSQLSNRSKDSFNNIDQNNKSICIKRNAEAQQKSEQPSLNTVQKISTPISTKNNQGAVQNTGFEDILKNYYEKLDQEEEKKSTSSIKDSNNKDLNNSYNGSNGSLNFSNYQQQPGIQQNNPNKVHNQEMTIKRLGSIQRYQSFESRSSFINSPKSQSNRVRPQISSTDQPSKQKGLATIYIELNEIMNSHILQNLTLSEKLSSLLEFYDIKKQNLQHYYAIFLKFVLIDDSKVFNPDTFASFKIHYQVFEQLQIILIETLKSLNYNTHAIEQIIERLEYQKKYIAEGLLVNEIGGSSGILKTIVESLEELNQKLPYNFSQQLSAEEKTATLTRVVTIICNQERLFSLNANNYINSIDQKSNFDIEMQPYLHYFKDFGQKEFYCFKLTFYTSLKQRGYRQQTIFRFLEQFEKARYKISSTLTMSNLLKDKQVYDQLVQDYIWKIQQDNQMCQAFENNKEVIQFFCHSVILEFIYSLHGRFDLYFLLSKLPHLTSSHLSKLASFLTSIVDYRGLSQHFINDIKIKFLKISYKLGLDKSPITLIKQESNNINFLEDLIQEINSIMHKDECFESFIQKFPEDKISLTIADTTQLQSGLRALNFFLLTLLSEYDIYSIQDLHSALQAFNVSITIPIQWKIAIEFALNNMKIPYKISQKIIELISLQFSLLYKNTQYEQFNQVLLN